MRKVVKTPFPADPLVTSGSVIGQAIRAKRTAGLMTIEEAAMTLGIGKQTLSDVELGKETVSIGIVLKVATAFGVSLFVTADENTVRITHALRGDSGY